MRCGRGNIKIAFVTQYGSDVESSMTSHCSETFGLNVNKRFR